MANPKKYRRPIEVIMQSDFVRLVDEAPIRYPFSYQVLNRKAKEGRIRTYGSPATMSCAEFEAQMKAGFPVIQGAAAGLAQKQS